MPYTLKTNQISVKDPETGEYSGVDILAEQTEQGLIAELQAEGTTQVNRINQAAVDVQAAVDQAESDAATIVSNTQTSINTLEAQKNTIAQTVASMAELGTDTTLSTPGMAADAGAVGDLKSAINSVEEFAWNTGFINLNGNPDASSDRCYSGYLLCPENTSITYAAETAHASVFGISFYDKNKLLISGVANNGTNAMPQTVTSPVGTRYCRLSTKYAFKDKTYYLPATQNLDYVTKKVYATDEVISNKTDGYIRFSTDGSIRGGAETIMGLIYAKVVDSNYQISVDYLNSQGQSTSSSWGTYFDLTQYKSPTALRIRKSDNSAMAKGSANLAVVGTYLDGYATNQYVFAECGTAFVDGTNGNDSNNGVSRTSAFKTIQAAIDAGFKNIFVRPDTYSEAVYILYKNGVKISADQFYASFDASTSNTNPKVLIDCNSTIGIGLRIDYSSNCEFEDIEIINSVQSGVFVKNSEDLVFRNCVVHDVSAAHGYECHRSNINFENCGAYNIGTMGSEQHHDGFNFHGTGTQNLINCWANYCEDDGVSHHDACEGYVDGGEWHHCGKGGVCTPTHGAKVNVQNIYAHDCNYGIYAGNDYESLAKTFNITNCVCLDNTTYDIYVTNNTANIWNCIYDTISHTGTGANNILMASS